MSNQLVFTCQHCSAQLKTTVDESSKAGNKAICSKCGKVTVVQSDAPPRDAIPLGANYEVTKNATGVSVRYKCPHCHEPLVSPLIDATTVDVCPSCRNQFMVPGERERNEFYEQLTDNRSAREAETVQRAAERDHAESKMQLARDPLREWFVYVAVAAILLSIGVGRHFIIAVTSDQTFLVPTIGVLFAIGVFLNGRGVRQLRIEYVCAAASINKLQTEGLPGLLHGLPAGVLHSHIQDLGKIAQFDPSPKQDNLVSLIHSRLMSRSKIVEILSSVLVSLGLVGTILGLINMTGGLNSAIDSLGDEDGSKLLEGMRETMSGLGTAFYTTLVGAILGSIVLRILNNVYTSNVDHLVGFIARTTEVMILPRLKKANE